MDRTAAAPTPTRRTLGRTVVVAVAALLAIVALGALACRSAPSSEVTSPSASTGVGDGTSTTGDAPLTEDDGVIEDRVSAFDDGHPGVARLDPDLLRALRRAATDAAHEGVTLDVTSGWRSPAYQDHLLGEAVAEHGSAEEAARWVATADTSAHVTGDAVDVGPHRATEWLARHGAAYGLCRTYDNEPWHHELRPEAVEHGCPPPYPDPTHDPRLHPAPDR